MDYDKFYQYSIITHSTAIEGSTKTLVMTRENPKHTTRTLAEEIGITPNGVERHLAILKSEGILHRIGPDKSGEWQVVELT